MKIIDKLKAIQDLKLDEPPWDVTRVFGNSTKYFSVLEDQICLGEDYVSLKEARTAIEWYVDQLGGSVKWTKITETLK